MKFKATEYIETRKNSFNNLKKIINLYKYPFIFSKSIYVSDSDKMEIECLFGHKMMVEPYKLKNVYHGKFIKNMPECWECRCMKIGAVEMKHRINIYYGSSKEIIPVSRYNGRDKPMRYKFGKNKFIVTTPIKMKMIIEKYPIKFRKLRGLFFEQILLERISNEESNANEY